MESIHYNAVMEGRIEPVIMETNSYPGVMSQLSN